MDSVCKVKIFACPIGPDDIFGIARVKANLRGAPNGVEGLCRDFIVSGDKPFLFDAEPYFYGDRSALAENYTPAQRVSPRVAKLFSKHYPNRNGYATIPLSDLEFSGQQVGLLNKTFSYVLSILSPALFNERNVSKEGLRSSLRESMLDFPIVVADWAKDAGKLLLYSGSKNLDSLGTSLALVQK